MSRCNTRMSWVSFLAPPLSAQFGSSAQGTLTDRASAVTRVASLNPDKYRIAVEKSEFATAVGNSLGSAAHEMRRWRYFPKGRS